MITITIERRGVNDSEKEQPDQFLTEDGLNGFIIRAGKAIGWRWCNWWSGRSGVRMFDEDEIEEATKLINFPH